MNKIVAVFLVSVFVLSFAGLTMATEEAKPAAGAAAPAADSDDMKWIAQCIMDNKDEGKPMEVVQKYCECMNSKMSETERLSVSEWEKKHPQEEKECSEKSGWK
jgi:hypothetical protein